MTWPSPCVICKYNGEGFYDPYKHHCASSTTEREALIKEMESLRMHVLILQTAVHTGMHYLKGRYPIPVKEKEVLDRMQRALDVTELKLTDPSKQP